ncbi:MAG: ferritin-like domain-containing protein [Acidobacteriota bacterium]|nr:ferritin-like domain-containing protein [Acidobacteriota bacterium]
MRTATRPHFDPSLFAAGPRRDARFTVVDQWMDCVNLEQDDPKRPLEFLHRQMNEEINGMENAAQSLVDFPDAEWGIRMCVARQCADEARHVQMFQRIFESRGGAVGEYPVMNFQYRIITNINNLIGRLAVQNRSFEAEGVDAVEPEIEKSRNEGDFGLADLFDAQLADEICHVRFANEYIAEASKRDPSSVMRVGRALDYGGRAFRQVMGEEFLHRVEYPTNQQGRLEAGFKPEEVQFAAAQRQKK